MLYALYGRASGSRSGLEKELKSHFALKRNLRLSLIFLSGERTQDCEKTAQREVHKAGMNGVKALLKQRYTKTGGSWKRLPFNKSEALICRGPDRFYL